VLALVGRATTPGIECEFGKPLLLGD
jgi:hypothetical protein